MSSSKVRQIGDDDDGDDDNVYSYRTSKAILKLPNLYVRNASMRSLRGGFSNSQ